jgi:DNA-binding MarR family transcriptional regulator
LGVDKTAQVSQQIDSTVAEKLSNNVERLYQQLRNVPLPERVTPERLGVLRTIESAAPVSVTRLAELHSVRPTTMSRMLAGLEGEGWIGCRGNKSDRRGKLISLTARGRVVCRTSIEQSLATLTAVLAQMSSADHDALDGVASALGELAEAMRSTPRAKLES